MIVIRWLGKTWRFKNPLIKNLQFTSNCYRDYMDVSLEFMAQEITQSEQT